MKNAAAFLPWLLLATACGVTDPGAAPPRADEAQAPAPALEAPAPRASTLAVKGSVVTVLAGDAHEATVELVVTDEAGKPAAGVAIEGAFTGGLKGQVTLTTNEAGVARAAMPGGQQHMSVGFSVRSMTELKGGAPVAARIIAGEIYPSPCCPLKTPPTQ